MSPCAGLDGLVRSLQYLSVRSFNPQITRGGRSAMTQVISRPLGRGSRTGATVRALRGARRRWQVLSAPCLVLALIVGGQSWRMTHATVRAAGPTSWLSGTTLLSVYGRGFNTAPGLGRLGQDRSFDDVARQVAPTVTAMRAAIPQRHVRIAIHLIYGLATPCAAQDTCLIYLDDTGVDIVRRYIRPAQRRGWLVVLDDQLGRSNPVSEIRHMAARGYLRFDNVEVAFDPEFRTAPGQTTPGFPTGSVDASELNAAQLLMNSQGQAQNLAHRKLMLIHAWNTDMIHHRFRIDRILSHVEPVFVMDGIGAPAEKVRVYNSLFATVSGQPSALGGVKIFGPGSYAMPGQIDTPVMSWPEVFGAEPTVDGDGTPYRMSPAPAVVVLT